MIKRNTIQCSLVFEAVNKLDYHTTEAEIYSSIIKEHTNAHTGAYIKPVNNI